MPCAVPTCGASVGSFRLFPRHIALANRWLEAIQVGCGVKAADDDDEDFSEKQICHWHFAQPDSEAYQEPKIFLHCETGKEEIDSCRLCLRFYPTSDMLSKNAKLCGVNIETIVYDSLRIDFQTNDFLELICIECLARLDLLSSIQTDFMDADFELRNLISTVQDNAKEIRRLEVQPPPMEESQDKYDSESADGEDSNDEWTAPNALIDISIKATSDVEEPESNSISRNESENPTLKLHQLVARKCYICPVILESANDLASHLTEKHSKKGANHCGECSRDFHTLSAYNYHLSRHDQTERPHKCSFCPIRFKLKKAMMIHENKYHNTNHDIIVSNEKTQHAVCETCGESFMLLSKLKYHIRHKHNGNKSTCNICGNSFTTKASLYRHMLLHTNEKPFVCNICDKPFRRQFNLKNHVLTVHEGKKPHVCTECNKDFKSYGNLYHHKQHVHLKKPKPSIQDNLKCLLCDDYLASTTDLKQHISVSHAEESYPYFQCPECPQKFLNKQRLYCHKAFHKDDLCVCTECGKKLTSHQSLKIHIESVHEKRQINCPICLTKSYTSQSALRIHMRTHTSSKHLSCDFCDKKFHRRDQLKIHRRTHTGEKPFECPSCSKRFGDDGTFSKHKKRCLATAPKKGEEAGGVATSNS